MTETRTPFSELARRRRSNLRMDPDRPIAEAVIDELLAIAATAPNHHRTHPWRFRIITGEGRRGLGDALASRLLADPDPDPTIQTARVAKARSKYLRAPVMVVVAARSGTDEVTTLENRDAVSASIQTLLLAATDHGLASLWSTGEAARCVEVASFCGFDPTDTVLGLIYLGWPTAELEPVERPMPESVRIDRA